VLVYYVKILIMKTTDPLISSLKEAIIENKNIKFTLSDPKGSAEHRKITASQKCGKAGLFFQFEFFCRDGKVRHENYSGDDATARLSEVFGLYRQCSYTVLDSEAEPHDRPKNYALKDGELSSWLCALGVASKDGKILADKQKKFRQINKFLEIAAEIDIPDGAKIVDAGCGKAYLTFALYDYLTNSRGKNVSVLGIDVKGDVIDFCNKTAKESGFNRLEFEHDKIEDFNGKTDVMVCLHACDTATDYAIGKAVQCGAGIILCAPCCQHELSAQVENEVLNPLLSHGILKERFASILTDALRALLLEANGYRCDVIEFIDAEHTAKNIMLRAVKKRPDKKSEEKALAQYRLICEEYNVKPILSEILSIAASEVLI